MRPTSILVLLAVLVIVSSPASAAAFEPARTVIDAPATGLPVVATPRWGERVPYRSFDGFDYTVTAFPGVHVEVLLSDSWVSGPQALTDEEIRRLVTRADLLYETYRDLTASEPQGEGPLRIAMVPIDAAVGYGWRGTRGIEIHESTLMHYREAMASDTSSALLSHEMAHNFDRTSNSYAIGADRLHAWTSLVQHLALIYEKGVPVDPSEALEDAIDALMYPPEWLADPRYSFEACAALDNDCGTPRINAMFAYLGLRALQLHGIERAPRLLDALTHWQERFGETYDARSAADIYIEILSETIDRDASCYADAWKWYASPALRQRLASRYGPNTFCADADGDGWTRLTGDPDDADPSSHPTAAEVPDGRDNDADGVIDNASFVEGVDAGFGADLPVTPPVVLDGAIDHLQVGDSFRFSTLTAQRFILTASRRGVFEGSVRLFRIDAGREIFVEGVTLAAHGPTRRIWQLTPGHYRMFVSGTVPGAYRLALRPAQEWPIAWGTVAPPEIADGRARLAVETNGLRVSQVPTHVVFWVEGIGEVAKLPWKPRVEFDWTIPGETMRFRYRARLVRGTEPLTGWSLPAESGAGRRRRSARH